ncbi:hypothetical protein KLA_09349 [Cellulophaga geojensis KL-A]|uniref:Uncharacterized protein n=1 Tax=Cellulophaga geojensis KL-A TaxID=1328323 RepID=A0ABN0RNS9_9FLAO|nr:hypothetical protein [Cellulophaga geojensis]EWH13540.1 hypothetical protein KLA_09349 [Cellulophaga geojensis KL-A]
MTKNITKIENITKYLLLNTLVFQKNKNVCWGNISKLNCSLIGLFNNCIWVYNKDDAKTIIYSIKGEEKKTLENFVYLRQDIFNEFDLVFTQLESNNEEFWALLDFKKLKIREKYPINYGLNGIWKILKNNKFLSKNDTDINCYYLDTEKEVWSFNFQQYTKQINNHLISNELLIIDNLLFLSFANSSLNAVGSIVINTDTGKVHKEVPRLKGFLYTNNNKEVIATSGIFNNIQTLSIFNLDTEECKTITLNNIFPTNNWSIKHQSSVVHNNKLYLAIQQGETLIASILAVLDLKTNKIIDYYELLKDPKKISNEDNWYHIDKIKVNDSMITVLTAGGTLHIFEKEETDLI